MNQARRFDVVVVGELNPDLILTGDIQPQFGQTEKLIDNVTLTIGSSSAIFACGAARLGLRVAFIGKVGADLFGDFMRQSLEEYGIDTTGVVMDKDTPSGISVILSKGDDRAILTYPGTIPLLNLSEIDQELIKQSRHLHYSSYFIQDRLRPDLLKLVRQAREWGLTISLDTNYDPSGKWDNGIEALLVNIDVFLPNAVELIGIARTTTIERAIDKLEPSIKYLGIKLGKDGAILCHNSTRLQVDAIQVKVVDTVGAGDSFDAGFVYGFLAGWEPGRVLKLANICGGLSTRQAGGTAAQPTIEETQQYF